ncbi:MAG: GNAT family N-acetyltransferase [Anaerolineae bacterium]|jgi:RimJ/RimL family protein N-acetyltransferase|nr:GNAT family N-acetyltransferase [Anaerolineae bacterium]
MTIPPLPDPLPADVLALRQRLPRQPAPVTLAGRFVRLEPLDVARHAAALFAVSDGRPARLGAKSVPAYDAEALIWRYMSAGPFATPAAFAEELQRQVDAPDGRCFCVIDVTHGQPVGCYNYLNNVPESLKIEVGGIWYSPLVQRTVANTEATLLALTHAFDLGYRRVEWKCHALNERSRAAALRLGFRFEGIQYNHLIVKERSRDTAWFAILEEEWPAIRDLLEMLIETGMHG